LRFGVSAVLIQEHRLDEQQIATVIPNEKMHGLDLS